ncbi:hypothetical protein [Brachybacterium muris]|uniref:hypothetical protein n=2 Tax=Brachybacterium muris TaxID=219301 RepID=UPI00034B4C61|nr:hypothetical protein [Brachybacterium muris]MCT1653066.1 hypothetical protein [Brachybacterium muris]
MAERQEKLLMVLRGDAQAARRDVAAFFDVRGWVPRVRDDGSVAYEFGNRGRTVLLGALAGKQFFLTGIVELREDTHTTDVVYRWGPGAGLALGGTLGRRRADRVHEETAAALQQHLEGTGRLLRTRRGQETQTGDADRRRRH